MENLNNVKKPFYAWVNNPFENVLFKPKADTRANCTVFYCSCYEQCEAHKNKQCVLKNGFGFDVNGCPYGKRTYEEGFTKRSKQFYPWINERKEKYADILSSKAGYLNPITRKIICIGTDRVFLNIPHLSNYVNSIYEQLNMDNAHVVRKDLITPEFLKKIVEYKPMALFGGEIKTYQEKEIPEFVRSLKRYYPQWYEGLHNIKPEVEDYIVDIDYRGREAYLKTLLPGKVCLKYKDEPVDWDGTVLKGPGKLFSVSGLEDAEITVTPKEDTVVKIYDNATVDENKIRLFKE